MRARLRWGSVALVVGALPLVVGCSATGVLVPEGYEALNKCDVRQYGVAELPALGEPDCDLEGSTVLFPDGTLLKVQEVGSVLVETPDVAQGIDYHSVNWGVPGIAVAIIQGGTVSGIWATSPGALDLHRQQLRIDGYQFP